MIHNGWLGSRLARGGQQIERWYSDLEVSNSVPEAAACTLALFGSSHGEAWELISVQYGCEQARI